MKKIIVLLTALIIVTLFSCDKEYKFYGFDISESVMFEIPAGEQNFDLQNIVDLYIEQMLEEKNSSADLIEVISIEEVSLDSADYSMIDSLDLHISASSINETILARNDSVDLDFNFYSGGYTVFLNVSEEKMDDYVKASSITIRAAGKLTGIPAENKNMTLHMRFRVLTYVK